MIKNKKTIIKADAFIDLTFKCGTIIMVLSTFMLAALITYTEHENPKVDALCEDEVYNNLVGSECQRSDNVFDYHFKLAAVLATSIILGGALSMAGMIGLITTN